LSKLTTKPFRKPGKPDYFIPTVGKAQSKHIEDTITMEEVLIPLNDGSRSLSRSNSLGSNKDVDLEAKGEEDTLDYRIHAKHSTGGKVISLWHDISLTHIDPETKEETPYYNFVCEIPKFTR
jgi:hypothetical protein